MIEAFRHEATEMVNLNILIFRSPYVEDSPRFLTAIAEPMAFSSDRPWLTLLRYHIDLEVCLHPGGAYRVLQSIHRSA